MIERVTNAGRVAVIGYSTIFVLENFYFPISEYQIRLLWAGVVILTMATLLSGISSYTENRVQRVFEAKGVEVNGKYPKLVKEY